MATFDWKVEFFLFFLGRMADSRIVMAIFPQSKGRIQKGWIQKAELEKKCELEKYFFGERVEMPNPEDLMTGRYNSIWITIFSKVERPKDESKNPN